jgi:hypothetical protein
MNSLSAMASVLIAAVAFGCSSTMAWPQPLPTAVVEEVMVKTSLLTLNDANLTGNYNVLHAKMAKAFRDKFGPEVLKRGFQSFAGHHIDVIAAKPIVSTSEAMINVNGALMLRGYFDTAPSRLSYKLDFAVSEGEWKLIDMDVEVKGTSSEAASFLTHAAGDFSAVGACATGREPQNCSLVILRRHWRGER